MGLLAGKPATSSHLENPLHLRFLTITTGLRPASDSDRVDHAHRLKRAVAQLRRLSTIQKRFILVAVSLTCLASSALAWHFWHHANILIPAHSYVLQPDKMSEWKAVGGDWRISDGVVYNTSYERGSKLLTGMSSWGNYTVKSDIQFVGNNADMGVIIRTSDERKEGSDTYNGYYVGLRTLDGTMVIGRSNFLWMEAPPVQVPGGIHPFVWYRLVVTAYGCNIAASAQNLSTLQEAWIALEDSSCFETGRIGLRSLSAGGMWRNISVSGSTKSDYRALQRHAGSVERLQVLPGPPWWTPWHVGTLFVATSALILLTQFAYFRIQKWKTHTITRERERLAHDIHDTMAQSFAGVGYQIQGIRRRVVRGERLDYAYLADQLHDTYQLVRNCHEEASRTISMLGSGLLTIQENLLGALADAARKITGDQVRIITELNGNPSLLHLRLADALLHIGREAIVNAVSHSDLNCLTLRLSYKRGSVELVVEDNGKGFEYSPEAVGFGILGMQKRARDVGVAFQIVSAPGAGTRVQVAANLRKEKIINRIFARGVDQSESPLQT